MGHEEKVINDAIVHTAKRDGKYLTFSLAGEEYGIGILKIREIIGMLLITSVPETLHYVKGVINLRDIDRVLSSDDTVQLKEAA